MTTNIWMKRLAAGTMLTAATFLGALGAAGVSNAATGSSADNGANMSQPSHHQSFPGEDFSLATPGSHSHRHHHHGW